MSRLLPHRDLAPELRPSLTQGECVAAWLELMEWGDELLLAGLQRDKEPDESLVDTVRGRYTSRMLDHDRKIEHMLQELSRREREHGN